MIHITRDLTDHNADALVSIDCDLCGQVAPCNSQCDPHDPETAMVIAGFLRARAGWKRSGRMIVCPRCRRRPRQRHTALS